MPRLSFTSLLAGLVAGAIALASPSARAESSNLLAGLATDFEHSGAGWQTYLLPHWPATIAPHQWETEAPGEGRRSLRIEAAFGVNSVPVPVAVGATHTLSFLARGGTEGDVLVVHWGVAGRGPLMNTTIRLGTEWKRHQVPLPPPLPDSTNLVLFFANGTPAQLKRTVFIDAVSLVAGRVESAPYVAPEWSLGLDTGVYGNYFPQAQEVTVRAALQPLAPQASAPEGWAWLVSDVVPVERVVTRVPVSWRADPGLPGVWRAEHVLPAGQALHRVVLRPPGAADSDLPAPTEELLVAQVGFEGLPRISDDSRQGWFGVHYQFNWTKRDGTVGAYDNRQPDETERLARLHHLGARWLRLHGTRPNPTKLYAMHPTQGQTVLYRDELTNFKNAGFSILGLLEVGWQVRDAVKPWFPHSVTTGGAWMSTLLPDDMTIWRDYVRTAVTGYAGIIEDWEIYNEANGQMSLDAYLPLLESAAEEVRKVDPSLNIVGICSTSDHGADFSSFLRQALERGAGKDFDTLSFHPYARHPDREGAVMLDQIGALAAKHVPGKPVWQTEVGHITAATLRSHAPRATFGSAIPAVEGAGWIARYMIESRRVGVARYFSYGSSTPAFAWQPWDWSPLYEYDGTPAPSFLVAGTTARLLDGTAFLREVAAHKGVRILLFRAKDGRLLAAAWSLTEGAVGQVELGLADPGPVEIRDAAGRSLTPTGPLVISSLPTWFSWPEAAEPGIETIFKNSKWRDHGVVTAALRATTGGMELLVSNTMSEAGKIRWIPRGDSARPLEVPAGETINVARVGWPETGRVALAGALRGDSGFAKDIALNIPLLRRSGEQIRLTSPAQIAFGHRAPDHWSGRPASFEARWDDQGLTLVIEATKLDRGWSQTRIGSSQHLMDSVELFLRTAPDTVDWGSTDYQPGDIKLSFAQESQAPSRRQLNADRGGEFIDTGLVEFSFRSKTQGGPGFVCEIRIPWAAIPATAGGRPAKWGFDVGINLSESGESRTYQYVWAGSAENWLRTDNWGLLIFD